MLSSRSVDRLRDIAEDAARITTFIDGMTLADFIASERTLFAVERLLQRMTEAAIQTDPRDADTLSALLPLAQMRGLGNRLRHEYRDLDRRMIFEIAQVEVPALADAVERALAGDARDAR